MRKRLIRKSSQRRAKAEAADFRRLWSDQGARNPSAQGMTFWRPVPPSGYASLGKGLGRLPTPLQSVHLWLQ